MIATTPSLKVQGLVAQLGSALRGTVKRRLFYCVVLFKSILHKTYAYQMSKSTLYRDYMAE